MRLCDGDSIRSLWLQDLGCGTLSCEDGDDDGSINRLGFSGRSWGELFRLWLFVIFSLARAFAFEIS